MTEIKTNEMSVVKRLVELQGNMPDEKFARYLGCSGSTWNRLKTGDYAADPSKMLERCENGLKKIEDKLASSRKLDRTQVIVPTDAMTAGLQAVKECADHPTNRLVLYLAPTGGGKSTFLRKVKAEYTDMIDVEATEVWRFDYFGVLVSMGERLKLGKEDLSGRQRAESAIVRELGKMDMVMGIDEGHHMGAAACNLLKLILNRTRTRLAVSAIDTLWQRMNSATWNEASQLVRRTYAKIVVNSIPYSNAKAFLENRVPALAGAAEEKNMVNMAVNAAKEFGYYDTLERIGTALCEEAGAGRITIDLMEAAINKAKAIRDGGKEAA